MSENKQPCKTPLEDLREGALAHYREASSKLCHWSSFVESAIRTYNPEEIKSNDSFQVKDIELSLSEDLKKFLDLMEYCKAEGMKLFPPPKPQAENKPDRDWQIECFVGMGANYWRQINGGYHSQPFNGDIELEHFLDHPEVYKIHSVKRLSNNHTFSIGETAGTKHFSRDVIKEFYIKDGEMFVITENDSCEFHWLSKRPQPQKEEQRIEVSHIQQSQMYADPRCTDKIISFHVPMEIPSAKFPLIKKAIENVINAEDIEDDYVIMKKEKVDELCEKAFNAGRGRFVNQENGETYYDYKTFQDYKSKSQK